MTPETDTDAGLPLVMPTPPTSITVETAANCNLRCVMCPLQRVPRGHMAMPLELVDRVSALLPGAELVCLHGVGEPLLSPAFWRLLERLPPRERCFSEVNTNGVLLDEERVPRIVESNLSRVNVSLDAATPETYLKIRGGDFEGVLRNIRRLCACRRQRQTGYPQVVVNMTLMAENVGELPAFVDLAWELGADAVAAQHLLPGPWWESSEPWRVVRSGWVFDYTEQELRRQPGLANAMVRQAAALAAQRGLGFTPLVELLLPE